MANGRKLRNGFGALVAGAWGGALVGLAEALLIVTTSPPEELGLFPFAFVAYGGLGAAVGLGIGLVALLGGGRPRSAASLACAAGFFVLALIVGRYHIVQRVFHEDLPPLSALGLAVHFGIVLAALLLAAVVYGLARRLASARRLLPAVLGLVLTAAVTGLGARLADSSSTDLLPVRHASAVGRPSVILIIADTLRADSVATRIAGRPNGGLARLARDGVHFPQAHAQSTWTRPSVATMMTSLYPSGHGTVQKMDPLPDDVTTLAETFTAQGYWTAAFVSNINVAPIFNFQQGFGEYHYLSPSFYFGASDSATRLAIYKGLRLARERLFRDRIYFQNYYQDAEVLTGAFSGWLAANPPAPFFLVIHFMDPHDPFFEIPYNGQGVARVNDPNPKPERAGELRGLYEQNVDYLDDHLAKLIDELDRRGLYQSSVVALVSDHGEEFQEHGGWWHGTTLYEEQLHVPMLVKRSSEPQAGTAATGSARLLDLAPTLVIAAGLKVPAEFAGRDLWSQQPPQPLFAEEDHEGNTLSAVRVGSWKLITANPDNPRGLKEIELYDLAADPSERHDQSGLHPERVEELAGLLDRFRDGGEIEGE